MRALLIVPLLAVCQLPGERPATGGSTSTTSEPPPTTAPTEEGGSTTGCIPHFAPLGIGQWECVCDAAVVDPVLCGCTFDEGSCSCPSYPCEEHPCAVPCAQVDGLCQCGTLVVPTDPYCS